MSIPSDEEFAKAEALARKRELHLDTIADIVRRESRQEYPLDYLAIWYDGPSRFRVYIFFDTTDFMNSAAGKSAVDVIVERVSELLEKYGRGTRQTNQVFSEVDSTERVGGNYWGRMH